ncbi:hypothetical protein [Spirosoma montaniterrae]|uniref:Uncharacterized protein n=1 Tax=Spirosoma montaniterrae TaxID=1178516 RepID=A0A1P9WU69_9BACT|nr:hypothetical protein [Spirosoma montaniterrae]AQG78909.1 hypothetical protein AWR27_05950 [Spirosoma montaniterrae]
MSVSATPARPGRLTCLTQNFAWSLKLDHTIEEIDQLISLLIDVQTQPDSAAIIPKATALANRLNALRQHVEYLRATHLCHENACESANLLCPCYSVRFAKYEALPNAFASLGFIFDQVRDDCYQFMTGPAGSRFI